MEMQMIDKTRTLCGLRSTNRLGHDCMSTSSHTTPHIWGSTQDRHKTQTCKLEIGHKEVYPLHSIALSLKALQCNSQ